MSAPMTLEELRRYVGMELLAATARAAQHARVRT